MTYISFSTKITPLYKNLSLLKLDDIYSLEFGIIMHKFHSGNLPDNFNHPSTPVNQVHCHATRSATKGAYFCQMTHTKYRKRSLKHLGRKNWDNIDPSLHDSSHLKNSTVMYLSLHTMIDSMVLKHGVLYVNYSPLHLTYKLQPTSFSNRTFPLPYSLLP